jgi:hypothetical protein
MNVSLGRAECRGSSAHPISGTFCTGWPGGRGAGGEGVAAGVVERSPREWWGEWWSARAETSSPTRPPTSARLDEDEDWPGRITCL